MKAKTEIISKELIKSPFLLVSLLILFRPPLLLAMSQADKDALLCDSFEVSAKNGKSVSQHLLAKCYQLGNGREQNFEKALYWFERALKGGDLQAKENILYINLIKRKDPSKYRQSIDSLKQMLKDNDGRAALILAIVYHNGIGVKEKDKTAMFYLTEAAQLNVPQAIAGMHYIYKLGLLGEAVNPSKAKYWFEKLEEYGLNHSLLKRNASEFLDLFPVEQFNQLIQGKH